MKARTTFAMMALALGFAMSSVASCQYLPFLLPSPTPTPTPRQQALQPIGNAYRVEIPAPGFAAPR